MRLTRKLLLALFAAVLVLMTVNAILHVRRETENFEADTVRDHHFVGRSVRAAVLAVWQSEGKDRAEWLLASISEGHRPIGLRQVVYQGPCPDSERPAVDRGQLGPLAQGKEVSVRQQGRFYTYVPFGEGPGLGRAIEVSESIEGQTAYVRASVLYNAALTAGLLLICGGLLLGLGTWFIGRPMAKLREKARRVGAGDLTEPLLLPQHDEIAEFANEMNAMCERLADANQVIAEQTAARIATLEQLRHADRLRTVGQLASGLAHELGTPLNVVLGRARLMTGGDCSSDEVSENARIIAEQATRMTALIRQLLDFARRRGPQPQRVRLRQLVEKAVQMLASLASKRHVDLQLLDDPRGVEVEVDPGQMQQVITNLAINGIQAMPQGGQLRLEVGCTELTPPAEVGQARGLYCFVKVKDQGVGIAPEYLGQVFEPFFTTKEVGEGTGLGLSVAYGIVRDHGGWIDVQSELGQGSLFTLYVPGLSPSHSIAKG